MNRRGTEDMSEVKKEKRRGGGGQSDMRQDDWTHKQQGGQLWDAESACSACHPSPGPTAPQ